jgi:hypothetical protein
MVSNYKTTEWINKNLGEDTKLLGVGVFRGYYSKRKVLIDFGVYSHWIHHLECTGEKDFLEFLKEEKVTHIWVSKKNMKMIRDHLAMSKKQLEFKKLDAFIARYCNKAEFSSDVDVIFRLKSDI